MKKESGEAMAATEPGMTGGPTRGVDGGGAKSEATTASWFLGCDLFIIAFNAVLATKAQSALVLTYYFATVAAFSALSVYQVRRLVRALIAEAAKEGKS